MGTQRRAIARWSTPRQLRKAGLFQGHGPVLGRAYGRLLQHNGPEHVLVVAATQSGKTVCLVIPTLLTWEQSALIHDPKEGLYPDTAGWRSTFSRVIRLAPTSSTSQHYNVLDGIPLRTEQEFRAAQLIAGHLTNPTEQAASAQSDTGRHFTEMAAEAVGGLILYGLYTQQARSLGALNALLVQRGWAPLLKAMAHYPHAGIQRAATVLTQTTGRDESSGIYSTLTRTLRVYTDPLIARATDQSDFTLRDLRERARPLSVYLSVPFGDQERLRPWTRLVVRQWLDYSTSRKAGWPWKLLTLLEELPSLRRFLLISDGLNYMAEAGVKLMCITPSLKEIEATYGRDHHFLEGCKVQVVFGLQDREVADTFSGRLGDTEVMQTRQVGKQRVREKKQEPLLSSTALMNLRQDQALVIVGQQKVLAQKTYYKAHREWWARSQLVCGS